MFIKFPLFTGLQMYNFFDLKQISYLFFSFSGNILLPHNQIVRLNNSYVLKRLQQELLLVGLLSIAKNIVFFPPQHISNS